MANAISDGLGSVDWTGIFSTSRSVLYWSIIIVLLGATVYFIYWIFSFKDTIIIKEKIGKAFEIEIGDKDHIVREIGDKSEDLPSLTKRKVKSVPYVARVYKAKVVKKKGRHYYTLLFSNLKLKLPDQVYQNLTRKGKKYIELTQISPNIFAPTVMIDEKTGEHQYIYDESWVDWVVSDIERDNQKYVQQNFWDKYGNWVMTAGMLIIIMIIIVVTLKHSQQVVNASKPLVKALTDALHTYKDSCATQNI